ncbi:hypothetical protein BH11PSE3_BH11PSE3_33070 [soil metagenome]
MSNLQTFVQNYIAVWNEADVERRRHVIRTLWQQDARHFARTLEAVGHAGIEKRVTGAYAKWVRDKGNLFQLLDGVDGHHDTIKLRWAMGPAAGGTAISIGFDFLVLGDDGRIRTGYQFIEA